MKCRPKRGIALLVFALLCVPAGIWGWRTLNRYAVRDLNLVHLVELGEVDAVRWILKWQPERVNEKATLLPQTEWAPREDWSASCYLLVAAPQTCA